MSGFVRLVFVPLVCIALMTGTTGWAQDAAAAAIVAAPSASPLISIPPSAAPSDPWTRILELQGGPTLFLAACCKTCRKGKACGDSCISRSYSCRKGVGCACDS